MRVAATLAIPLAAILQGTASAQTQDPARDAYLDDTARQLVLGLKAARDTARLTIDTYTALIRERLGFEWPSPRRNRPWVHGERTARVRWSRDEPAIVHVLAARFRTLLSDPEDSEFFTGLRTERFAADPLGDPFKFGFTVVGPSPEAEITTRSPLGPVSERYYQFRSGDTTTVRLSDGSTLRAVAVTVIPRYRSIRLVSAIMWIDAESFGLARVAYRLAKPVDREMTWRLRSGGRWSPGLHIDISAPDPADRAPAPDSTPDRPGFFDRLVNGAFNSAFPRLRLDISTVVAEYGLWEMRHWLPRSVAWRGDMSAREGVTAAGVAPLAVPAMIDWTLEIEDIRERGAGATPGTPATAAEALRLWRQEGDSISGALTEAEPGETVTITPADRQALAASDLLPPTVWEEEGGVDDATIEQIAAELAGIGTGEGGDRTEAPSPWLFDPPGKTLRLLRYNPVERVSVGTRLQRDFGWGRAALTARVGTGGAAMPDIDLTLQRNHPGHTTLVSFYRSLRDGEPGEGGSTPGIYVTGDTEDFHWSHGAAIRFLPPLGERSWLSLRLFAEQDATIPTDVKRNRVGAAVAWTPWWGTEEPGSFGGGGRAGVRASAGDNPHVRAVVEGTLVIPLFSRLFLGIQAGTARVWGDPAPHDLWRIGASGRWLRGHRESVRGARVHMAGVDLQRPIRFLRLSVFGDWASAGGDDFYAIGAGLVFMDGILRLDVARGLRWGREGGPDPVLRLHLFAGALF
ncbi:hypothetical protein [Candidatus Palauibacter sp.]|uniref:hypothetical protein n=1 Tax=Candidatus Palauibacter sp. TaxID=3101350 RepID=UPI003CC5B7E8